LGTVPTVTDYIHRDPRGALGNSRSSGERGRICTQEGKRREGERREVGGEEGRGERAGMRERKGV
jgi:hypothetical protein